MAEREAYPSDVSDAEWAVLAPFIPRAKPGGRPRSVNMREIVNGIFYVARGGGSWRMLPHELPNWRTVYGYVRDWVADGRWERMNDGLRTDRRIAQGRNPEPSTAIIDSQRVKTTGKEGFAASTATSR